MATPDVPRPPASRGKDDNDVYLLLSHPETQGIEGLPPLASLAGGHSFPGLYYVSALQREGLKIYDSHQCQLFFSNPYIYLGGADAPGMDYMSGLVGPNGANGCRIYCLVPSHHREGGTHWYPASQSFDALLQYINSIPYK